MEATSSKVFCKLKTPLVKWPGMKWNQRPLDQKFEHLILTLDKVFGWCGIQSQVFLTQIIIISGSADYFYFA